MYWDRLFNIGRGRVRVIGRLRDHVITEKASDIVRSC